MQKYIINLIILLIPSQIFAQKLSFSVVFDPQITWLNSDSKSLESDGTRFGFNAGLVMDNYFADNYAFSTGVSILQTGGNLMLVDTAGFQNPSWLDTLSGTTVSYNMQYITVPLSLKLKSNQIGYNTFFAHLGVNAHMNVRAFAKAESVNIQDEDIKDELKFFMMSYFIGGGIEYSLGGNTALMAGLYFNNGFLDARKTDNYSIHIGSVALRLGIKF
jgi:hypothetical protein